MDREQTAPARVIVVMGVAGAGKTTVGVALAKSLGWPFHDGDDFHSPANIAKMHRGEALTDADRAPWLAELCTLVAGILHRGEHGVLACSALKQWYRDAIVPKEAPQGAVQFVHLDVPEEELRRRLARRGHFFAPELLGSQLATLEKPTGAIVVDGARPVDDIIHIIRDAFRL